MPERPVDADEMEPDPMPPRGEPAGERLVDVVERAFAYLRHHPAPAGSPDEAERRALIGHMARILSQTPGYPRPAVPPPARPGRRAWSAIEMRIAALVAELDAGRGADWSELLAAAARERIPERAVEAALDALMDAGLVYEPVLGRLKRT